jgi:hypothetical protein
VRRFKIGSFCRQSNTKTICQGYYSSIDFIFYKNKQEFQDHKKRHLKYLKKYKKSQKSAMNARPQCAKLSRWIFLSFFLFPFGFLSDLPPFLP